MEEKQEEGGGGRNRWDEERKDAERGKRLERRDRVGWMEKKGKRGEERIIAQHTNTNKPQGGKQEQQTPTPTAKPIDNNNNNNNRKERMKTNERTNQRLTLDAEGGCSRGNRNG